MARNKYMHPRNVYKNRKPDFKMLASKYDYFKEKVTVSDSGKVILDFKDPAALRALTQVLLQDDFGLMVTIPLDRLIPTVPQRLNYILWLEDIIGRENGAKGIDIGTGASCIYPLLGCRLNQWRFLASEIDDQNIYFANKNITSNKMEDKITVKKVSDDTLLLGFIDENDTYDFCMCNPPFYSDHLEAQGITTSRNDNRSESSSVSTASEAESIAWGGEVRFVTQMIEESVVLKTKVRVYTSLLGKKNSLSQLKEVLQKKQVPKYSSTEFCQGRTMRWGIAWTFDTTVEFPKSAFQDHKKEKPPLSFEIPRSSASIVGDYTVQSYTWFVIRQLEELKICFFTKHSGKFYSCFIIRAQENTWSHQRRKRRLQKHQELDKCFESGTCTEMKDRKTNEDNVSFAEDSEEISSETREERQSESAKEGKTVGNQRELAGHEERNIGDSENAQKVKLHVNSEADEDDTSSGKGEMEVIESQHRKRSLQTNIDDPHSKRRKTDDANVEGGGGCVKTKEVELADSNATQGLDGDTRKGSKQDNFEIVPSDEHEMAQSAEETEHNSKNCKVERKEEQMQSDGTINSGRGENKSEEAEAGNRLVRKEVIERFWKEQEANTEPGKKKERSFMEVLEPFKEDEKCLVLCKMVIRKDEGVISFSLTHLAGQREAMHQIMQYFKNKWNAK